MLHIKCVIVTPPLPSPPTCSTVGYGDQVPVTTMGKVIAVLTMFCGLVVLSLPITIIGANFDDEYRELRKRAQDAKEITRRKERAALRQQQQQVAAAGPAPAPAPDSAQAPAAKETPQRAGSDKGGAEGVAPLTYPPSLPVVSDAAGFGEDPIKLIQTMIHEAHYALTMEVEKLMVDHENKLRLQVKQVLKRHASGMEESANRATPLDQQRGYPPPDGDEEG